ncbi:MAG: glycosyl hydrolase, partial [Candidatus Scalindua sp.]
NKGYNYILLDLKDGKGGMLFVQKTPPAINNLGEVAVDLSQPDLSNASWIWVGNTEGAFRTSLETVKQSDDMNFITGINHSVLHGYNYSPPEAGFPGWIRYGAYFSEHNTWWKYFRNWAEYNYNQSESSLKNLAVNKK